MESSVEEKPEISQTENQPPLKKKSNFFSIFGKVMLVLLAIGALIFGGYYLGTRNTKKQQGTTNPTLSPTKPTDQTKPTVSTPTDSGIPIKANTVSFARVNGEVFMRYKGKIYNEEAASKTDPSLTKLPNPDSYIWYGLVDAPSDVNTESFDELFDFKVMPNKSDFSFIMRWTKNNNAIDYTVFYYDGYKPTNKVSDILNFIDESAKHSEFNVPRFKQISTDGRYFAFNMFSCWNCGGHAPDTLLFSFDTGLKAVSAMPKVSPEKVTKRIGKTSYFNWKANGDYEYKEYKVIPCKEELQGPGECSEDPKNLPSLSNSL